MATTMNLLLVPRDAGDVEDLLENDCTGVQGMTGRLEDGVHNNDYQREHRLGALAVALLHQRRMVMAPIFQVNFGRK